MLISLNGSAAPVDVVVIVDLGAFLDVPKRLRMVISCVRVELMVVWTADVAL